MPEIDRDLHATKEEVRARNDIVEVVSQYTRLKRTGKSWTGLCPFHADKKPSFSVHPETQTYRCWSCGEKGDVFTFIEKKENLEFVEALELLARRAGIAIERRGQSREQASEREQMFAINALAARYYQERLGNSSAARDYLANRGILKQTQEQWDLGFAPDEWEGLTFFLQRQRADLAIAAKLGLIRSRDPGGKTYDTFRNRLMFPIHDLQGRVIAFGGRAMGDDPAKYINSEQSAVFDKSRTLYGLAFARKSISSSTPAVFVEGYVDVITTHQAGFTQCVATLGTSMTEEHARLLARYSPRVIICYDGDSAGIKATMRGAAVWESIGIEGAEVRVARLPAGDDPDSLVRNGRTADFQRALDEATPRVDFEIEQALQRHAVDTDEGREQALAEIIPIIATVPSAAQRDKYVERVAHLHSARRFNFQRAITALLADVEQYQRKSNGGRTPRDRGFPLTEQSNRRPLASEPAPPTYRPPSADGWGRWDRGGEESGRRTGGGGRYGRREARDPLRDYSAPSLTAPPLSGVEKSERQLLRALLTADWRSFVLARIHPDHLVTDQAKEMFALAARQPAREDGSLDPVQLLRQAEEAEAVAVTAGDNTGSAPGSGLELFSAGPEEMHGGAVNTLSPTEGPEPGGQSVIPAKGERAADYRSGGINRARTSDFIREVLEDSLSVMSNEPLNEAVLVDCIRRLQRHRDDLATREITELLNRTDLPPEQRETAIQRYHEKMRQSRGSPPVVEDDND